MNDIYVGRFELPVLWAGGGKHGNSSSLPGADPGGGVQGPPPPGPQRGGPGPLFQNEENSIYYLQLYLIPPNKSL